MTPLEKPRGDTHPLRPNRVAPGRIERFAVLQSKYPVQAPMKRDLTPGKPRRISGPCRTLVPGLMLWAGFIFKMHQMDFRYLWLPRCNACSQAAPNFRLKDDLAGAALCWPTVDAVP